MEKNMLEEKQVRICGKNMFEGKKGFFENQERKKYAWGKRGEKYVKNRRKNMLDEKQVKNNKK